jgi:hypothetical protein
LDCSPHWLEILISLDIALAGADLAALFDPVAAALPAPVMVKAMALPTAMRR